MDVLCAILMASLVYVAFSLNGTSGPVEELTVRPGDNITLYCDCQISTGAYIVWFRNCSHENQPTLVMSTFFKNNYIVENLYIHIENPFPRFKLDWNQINNTYNLLIENVTESDLGLYYCGTEENKVDETEKIGQKMLYRYGNIITMLLLERSEPLCPPGPDCGLCWILMFTLCPGCVLLSSLFSSIMVYHFCIKTATLRSQVDQTQKYNRRQESNQQQDGDDWLCYAALDIRKPSQRPRETKRTGERTSPLDHSTYASVKTSSV